MFLTLTFFDVDQAGLITEAVLISAQDCLARSSCSLARQWRSRRWRFDLQSFEEFVKLPTCIGELYAPEAREAIRWLHDDASRSTPLRMPSWTSSRWA